MEDKSTLTLQTAIRGFLLHCTAENKSPRTVEWYESTLNSFQRWLRDQRAGGNGGSTLYLDQVAVEDVRGYLAWMKTPHLLHPAHKEKRPAKANTVRGHWASLSAFFGWCVAEEFLRTNPVARVKPPKVEVTEIDTLRRDEVKQILDACDTKRDKALIRFMLDTLCRVREVTQLCCKHLELERGRAKVMGKGSRERYVYFGRATRKALWLYIETERPEPLPGDDNDRVFLRHDGLPLNEKALTKHIRKLGRRAGVPRLHAHLLRHTGAIERLRNGQDVFTLQRLLGHSTLEMVRRYLRALKNEDAENASRSTAPGDRWRL